MKKWLKLFWWDLHKVGCWYQLISSLLNIFPGESGKLLRGYILSKFFKSSGQNVAINPNFVVFHSHKLVIGDNFLTNVNCVINAAAGVVCGNNVAFGPGVKIWTVNHNFNEKLISYNKQGYSEETVTIGNDVWLGANVIVLPGVNIPDGVVIGAGAVVTKHHVISPYGVYVGNPLRKIKDRV